MYEIKNSIGNSAKVYASTVEDSCLKQLGCIMENPAYMDSKVRVMPDFEHFETLHNYVDADEMMVRKGAVSAKRGERLIIPINHPLAKY